MLRGIPVFWQGVLSSLLAAIITAICVHLFVMVSLQTRQRAERRKEFAQAQFEKIRSPDSILRVEGYFVALFELLKYLFVANILWVVSDPLVGIFWPLGAFFGLASLVTFYLGLRWLYDISRGSQRKLSPSALSILSARYGARDTYVDVKNVLQKELCDTGLSVIVGNQLADDPVPSVGKVLEVHYAFEGKEHVRRVPERQVLSIP